MLSRSAAQSSVLVNGLELHEMMSTLKVETLVDGQMGSEVSIPSIIFTGVVFLGIGNFIVNFIGVLCFIGDDGFFFGEF